METKYKKLKPTTLEQEELESWVRAGGTAQKLVLRARIILLNSSNLSALEISQELGISRPTIYKWVRRFGDKGIISLKDAPRPGQPKKLSTNKIKQVLRLTVERVPKEASHWSQRLMAKYANITRWQVQQIWNEAGLKPHRIKGFKISNDPQFAEKVVDVVGLYRNPPVSAMVLSVDEKTQIQALDRTQPMLPMRPGQLARRSYDYKRNGVTNLYAAFDIATGQVIGRVTKRHRAKEFLAFLRQIERTVPPKQDLHLILDNSATHKTEEIKKWLANRPRFHVHFTPTSASWLNAVESWFSSLERRSLYRGVFTNVKELRDEIHRYIKLHNENCAKPFQWTKEAKDLISAHNRAKKKMYNN